jgi:two-component system, NtrC family, response regulator AtoC
MSGTWLRHRMTSLARDTPDSEDAEAVTMEASDGTGETVRALYVTGPNGGARHVLPEGLVSLGRSTEATIVVNDLRVSRSHAALHVDRDVTLSDLGSANGTFLGKHRLALGEAVRLAEGQSFFIGDSSLTVRPCPLRRAGAKRLAGIEDVRGRFWGVAASDPTSMVVIRLRLLRRMPATTLEAIVGELLESPRDFMFWLDADTLLLGIVARAETDTPRLERDVIRQLASFSAAAEVSARLLSPQQVERAGDGLRALLSGNGLRTLARGNVLLEDPAMKALEQTVLRVAKTSVNVLILGETGSGKDVVAAMLHELSGRPDKPFVALNCASLPEALVESELFGHERGAFTGATSAKPGLLEAADGGTVFLDEVGELALPLQAKLLRVIEAHEVTRLGALKPRAVDVRFVAATNLDLARHVANGRFRQDLYYRLNSVTLNVPPLRERPSEIAPLARLFLENACARFETGDVRFSPAAVAALAAHNWPGNVRELKSTVERGALLARAPTIEPADLGLPTSEAELDAAVSPRANVTQANELATSPAAERQRIIIALEECGGNQSRAAKALGISRRTLVRKIAQLGLPRPREKH